MSMNHDKDGNPEMGEQKMKIPGQTLPELDSKNISLCQSLAKAQNKIECDPDLDKQESMLKEMINKLNNTNLEGGQTTNRTMKTDYTGFEQLLFDRVIDKSNNSFADDNENADQVETGPTNMASKGIVQPAGQPPSIPQQQEDPFKLHRVIQQQQKNFQGMHFNSTQPGHQYAQMQALQGSNNLNKFSSQNIPVDQQNKPPQSTSSVSGEPPSGEVVVQYPRQVQPSFQIPQQQQQQQNQQMMSVTESQINSVNCDARLEVLRQKIIQQLGSVVDEQALVINGKQKSLFLQMRSQRGSRFRGVSKNGHKWQVMIVKGELRKYLGAISSEEQAARFYDKYSIIIQGLEAKTNFSYTRDQAIQLLTQSDELREERSNEVQRGYSQHDPYMQMGGRTQHAYNPMPQQMAAQQAAAMQQMQLQNMNQMQGMFPQQPPYNQMSHNLPIFHSAPVQSNNNPAMANYDVESSHNSSSHRGPSSIASGGFMPIRFSSRPEKAPSTNAEILIANPHFNQVLASRHDAMSMASGSQHSSQNIRPDFPIYGQNGFPNNNTNQQQDQQPKPGFAGQPPTVYQQQQPYGQQAFGSNSVPQQQAFLQQLANQPSQNAPQGNGGTGNNNAF